MAHNFKCKKINKKITCDIPVTPAAESSKFNQRNDVIFYFSMDLKLKINIAKDIEIKSKTK